MTTKLLFTLLLCSFSILSQASNLRTPFSITILSPNDLGSGYYLLMHGHYNARFNSQGKAVSGSITITDIGNTAGEGYYVRNVSHEPFVMDETTLAGLKNEVLTSLSFSQKRECKTRHTFRGSRNDIRLARPTIALSHQMLVDIIGTFRQTRSLLAFITPDSNDNYITSQSEKTFSIGSDDFVFRIGNFSYNTCLFPGDVVGTY